MPMRKRRRSGFSEFLTQNPKTKAYLARHLEISERQLYRYATGESSPPEAELHKIQAKVDELTGGGITADDWPPKKESPKPRGRPPNGPRQARRRGSTLAGYSLPAALMAAATMLHPLYLNICDMVPAAWVTEHICYWRLLGLL